MEGCCKVATERDERMQILANYWITTQDRVGMSLSRKCSEPMGVVKVCCQKVQNNQYKNADKGYKGEQQWQNFKGRQSKGGS